MMTTVDTPERGDQPQPRGEGHEIAELDNADYQAAACSRGIVGQVPSEGDGVASRSTSSYFLTLPDGVRGNCSTRIQRRGIL